MKLFLDTNVIVDALVDRGPAHQAARLLLALGKIGELELWASPSQWTDLFYILTEGGQRERMADIKRNLEEVRKAVHVSMLGEREVDDALASQWGDFEDAVVYQAARAVAPRALITSNTKDYKLSEIPIFEPDAFFEWMRAERGITYAVVKV